MSKIVVRHNFETNSSSMHSLALRRSEGEYNTEELTRSEAMVNDTYYDAIITLSSGRIPSAEEIKKNCWIWRDQMGVYAHSLEMRDSAMQVLSTFRDKLEYAIATVYGYRYKGWEKRLAKIKEVFAKVLPDIELAMDRIDEDDRRFYRVGPNNYLLYPFLKKNGVTLEEFLTNTKYIVIINYAEYEKMKWLGMVDESKIVNIFRPDITDSYEMKIENGVWKLAEGDISFGRYPFRVLGTPEGKARYALANENSENIDEILSIMQEIYPEMKSIELPKDEYSDDGVDHGYCDDYGCTIPNDVPLREFILNKKYVVISDGDEYCIWKNFKKTPLFNREEYPDEKLRDEYESGDDDD